MRLALLGLATALAVLVEHVPGLAADPVLTTAAKTFIGATGVVTFVGGVPQCAAAEKSDVVLTLPDSTLPPTSPATQISWTPNGNQTSAYTIAVVTPGGTTVQTWTIGARSTAQDTYSAPDAPAGPWSLRESGLPSSVCSGGALMGSPGTASGTAGWYESS